MSEEKVGGDEPSRSGDTSAPSKVPGLPAHGPQSVALRTSLDTRLFPRTMGLFATGVTVITTRMNGSVHGITANSVTSLSLDPLLMLIAINRRASMCIIIPANLWAAPRSTRRPPACVSIPIPTACRTSAGRSRPFTAESSGWSMVGITSSSSAGSSTFTTVRRRRRWSTFVAATARSVTWRRKLHCSFDPQQDCDEDAVGTRKNRECGSMLR